MATARMRKTFAYPDSDNDSEPEGLDEQEQEQLIANLISSDAQKTENYKKAFLVLPLLSIILYLPSLKAATLVTHILAITSLLSSAYATYMLPSKASDIKPKRPPTLATLGRASRVGDEEGPLKRYLNHLNAGICVVLALQAIRAKSQGQIDEVWLAVLPSLVFLLLFLARTMLKPVDVAELEKLRYGYKGA